MGIQEPENLQQLWNEWHIYHSFYEDMVNYKQNAAEKFKIEPINAFRKLDNYLKFRIGQTEISKLDSKNLIYMAGTVSAEKYGNGLPLVVNDGNG